jgi:hypothetical protein
VNVRNLISPAGIATPLLSGGWLVDLGEVPPQWVPDRASARQELGIPDTPAGLTATPVAGFPRTARPGPNLLDP